MKRNQLISIRRHVSTFALVLTFLLLNTQTHATDTLNRLETLVATLQAGPLKQKLQSCLGNPLVSSDFSIGHRGAPLTYPEHTREGYIAAHQMGAGAIECDVTFTKDKELVCRHSQCDLHSSTNILETPLAASCSVPPDMNSRQPFRRAQCCTSDITLAEFKSLKGRQDKSNKKAKTLEEFYAGTQASTNTAGIEFGELLSHKESIELFDSLGVGMVPELKKPQVSMPFDGFTQQQYATAIVKDYIDSGINPQQVKLQSFNLDDVHFWLENFPEFGQNAVWLDGRYTDGGFNHKKEKTWKPDMEELYTSGVSTIAPPLWMLLARNETGEIVPSHYANSATEAGLDLVAWTLERSGSLKSGGGWYYQTIGKSIKDDGDLFRVLDVLAHKVQVEAVFSDWPASSTFFANCFGLD